MKVKVAELAVHGFIQFVMKKTRTRTAVKLLYLHEKNLFDKKVNLKTSAI